MRILQAHVLVGTTKAKGKKEIENTIQIGCKAGLAQAGGIRGNGVVIWETGFRMAIRDLEEEDLSINGPSDEDMAEMEKGLEEEEIKRRRRIKRWKRKIMEQQKDTCRPKRKEKTKHTVRDWPPHTGPREVGQTSRMRRDPWVLRQQKEAYLKMAEVAFTGQDVRGIKQDELCCEQINGLITSRARKLFEKWAKKIESKVKKMVCQDQTGGAMAEHGRRSTEDDGTVKKNPTEPTMAKEKGKHTRGRRYNLSRVRNYSLKARKNNMKMEGGKEKGRRSRSAPPYLGATSLEEDCGYWEYI